MSGSGDFGRGVAVLGAGKMGEALLAGLLKAGQPADALCFTERHDARAAEVAERLGLRRRSVVEAAALADVLFVAVKPQDIEPLLVEIAQPCESTPTRASRSPAPRPPLLARCPTGRQLAQHGLRPRRLPRRRSRPRSAIASAATYWPAGASPAASFGSRR